MRKVFTLCLVTVILLSMGGCGTDNNPTSISSVSSSQQQNTQNTNTQPAVTSSTAAADVKHETIWKLIDENKVEDITPVFETARYILMANDSRFYKNIDYGSLSFFKVDGRTGVVDDKGEIRIPYTDNARWCFVEGFVDEKHNPYDSEFKKKDFIGGHGGASAHYFDLNTQKLVMEDESGPVFIDIDDYIKNNYQLSGIYKAAYFKPDKDIDGMLNLERETGLYIVIDDKGNPITEPNIQDGTSFYNGISAIKKDNKWGFIDLKGNMIVDFQYDYAYNFTDNTAAVSKDGKWGYINKDGSIYKDFVFDAARSFYKSKAWVKLNGKWQIYTSR